MRNLIIFPARTILIFWLLLVSSEAFDDRISLITQTRRLGGSFNIGVPFPHTRKGPPSRPGYPPSFPLIYEGRRAANAVTFACIATASVFFSPLRVPVRAPRPSPAPVAPATAVPMSRPQRPTAETAAPEAPRFLGLARRSRWLLAATVVTALLGHGIAGGFLGWQLGKWIHGEHEQRGRRAPWAATEAWVVGRAVTITMLVCALGSWWYSH